MEEGEGGKCEATPTPANISRRKHRILCNHRSKATSGRVCACISGRVGNR